MNENEAGEDKKVNEDDDESSSQSDPENDDIPNMATPTGADPSTQPGGELTMPEPNLAAAQAAATQE